MKRKIISRFLAVGLFISMTVGLNTTQPISFLTNKTAVVYADTTYNYNLPDKTKDGVMLHAFDWSFNTIKNELPNIAAAGFKSVQVSPVQGTKSSSKNATDWWVLYQPTNESVGNAQLGTYDDFKSLCSEAKKYGISIIVDAIMNHMANNGNKDQLDPSVDSSFQRSDFYHNKGQCDNYDDREKATQGGIGMPDLNTQNHEVQDKAIQFLNQCIDAGASGFRFDAAKHIETNKGQDAGKSWAGDYWDRVLGSLHNKDNIFLYGEVLQCPADNINVYESYMKVTAHYYGGTLRNAVRNKNLTGLGNVGGINNDNAVSYVENHDNFENDGTGNYSKWEVKMAWSALAAREGVTPLFFSRPTGSIGTEGDDAWKDADIAAVNKFHNAMVGQDEYLRWTRNETMLVERGNAGMVIVNVGGDTDISSDTRLASGTYTNQAPAGGTFTVSNGKITGHVPGGQVIVLYKQQNPVVKVDPTEPVVGQNVTITYNASGRTLDGASNVKIHWGYDGWKGLADTAMTSLGNNEWKVTFTVPTAAQNKLDFSFTDGSKYDNNDGNNWSATVTDPSQQPVTWDNQNPTAGSNITITYNASAGSAPLKGASNIRMHWGYDSWKGLTDTTMTSVGDNKWQATITIPTAAASDLDLVFTDGSKWDNNGGSNWKITISGGVIPKDAVTWDNQNPTAGSNITITYNASAGNAPLKDASIIKMHWGYDGWKGVTDIAMTSKGNNLWQATITIPTAAASSLNLVFTDGTKWDNNSGLDWKIAVAGQIVPTDTVTWDNQKPTAGSNITITYYAVNRTLQDSSNVTLHWGYDSWKGVTDTAMTSKGNNIWQATLTIPSAAASNLNLAFTNGSKWDNNSSKNWSIALNAVETVSWDNQNPTPGSTITITYNAANRALQGSSNIKIHWGYDSWKGVTETVMTSKGNNIWQVTLTIPSSATSNLNFVFTNGSKWDNNSSKNWNIALGA